jgi:hypothetical protein
MHRFWYIVIALIFINFKGIADTNKKSANDGTNQIISSTQDFLSNVKDEIIQKKKSAKVYIIFPKFK